jgi:hypothetical protein
MSKKPTIHTIASLLARTIEVGECQEWQGYFANHTPKLFHEGQVTSVRRVLCMLKGQNVPKGFFVGHTCGNPKCVNPKHAAIRNMSQQAKAMCKQVDHMHPSRLLKLTESAQVRRKLTDEQLQEIIMGDKPRRILAAEFSVHPSLISRIRAGKAHRMSAARNNPFFRLIG